MTSCFDLVCLFGFSPHFSQIARFLDGSARCIIVFGPRQKNSVESLDLPSSTQQICVESLDDATYKNIAVREHNSLGISIGSPFIFTQNDIDDFDGQLINSHGAPLPEFKGGGGFSWRILQRDKRGSILMHYVTTKIDQGAYVFRKNFMFSDDERMPGDYEKRQFKEESEQLLPWIKKVVLGETSLDKLSSERKSKVERGSYYPRLSSDLHGGIDWTLPLHDLESFVLAFSRPYSGAYTYIKGQKINIFNFRVERECYMHPFTYGLVLNAGPESFLVSCNGGIIELKFNDLILPNSDLRLNPGDRFYTPESIRERALSSRVFYRPDGLVARNYM